MSVPRCAWLVTLLTAASAAVIGGCGGIAESASAELADSLTTAILEQDDPELVREGLPSYLLLLNGLAAKPEARPDVLQAEAALASAYAVLFVSDPARARALTRRARDNAARALCAVAEDTCDIGSLAFADFEARIGAIDPDASPALLTYAIASLAYVRTHDDDLVALADLPKIERLLERLLVIGDRAALGAINGYLGILNSLRPPALGGQPDRSRSYFERAIELTAGRDLGIQVEYARLYARMTYDRELHDRLLKNVLATNPESPRLTMLNVLAQRQARELLASADDYF